jgi:hypothetical protein
MIGHSLDVWTRHYAGDYGKPQRDEARARMLEHGFGTVEPEVKDVAGPKTGQRVLHRSR